MNKLTPALVLTLGELKLVRDTLSDEKFRLMRTSYPESRRLPITESDQRKIDSLNGIINILDEHIQNIQLGG